MVKSALQLHARPSEEAVRSYHKHLMAEFETLAGAAKPKKPDVPNPKLQAIDGSGGSGANANPSGGAGAKVEEKEISVSTCCPSKVAGMELRARIPIPWMICLRLRGLRSAWIVVGRNLEQQSSGLAASILRIAHCASHTSHVHGFLPSTGVSGFKATRGSASHPRGFIRCHGSGHISITCESHTGRWWSTASAFITTIHQAFGHHLYHACQLLSSIFIWSPKLRVTQTPLQRLEKGVCGPDLEVPLAYALLDSGATHPMRQAKDDQEWEAALEVQVALAGDNTTSMRLTSSGTLLLPPGRDGSIQPIVPMGAIIEQLGYKLVWSAGSCKLYPPDGRSIRLRVKNGCPEVAESQALTLISRLEEHKLNQADELRR